MKKIRDYQVLNEYPKDINGKVKQLIEEGWQPLGPAMPYVSNTGHTYCTQTMVKYHSTDNV